MELFDLKGRRALVTGSSQGIGLALAEALARAGASVLLNGRDETRLDEAVTRLAGWGLKVAGAPFDVTDPNAAERAIAQIEEQTGPIDILVNNAGIQRRQPLQDFSAETWREVMSANLDSVFYVSQAVARRMIPRGHGKIINISSLQSEAARPGIAPLHGVQRCSQKPHQGHVRGLGPVWPADQCHWPGLLRYPDEQVFGR